MSQAEIINAQILELTGIKFSNERTDRDKDGGISSTTNDDIENLNKDIEWRIEQGERILRDSIYRVAARPL
jgi:hypothetical protein